jgi:hypothetical protein
LDLSVNKVLALAGRDEPRDFLDVLYVHRKHLGLGALCWAATGKDPGFNPESLVEMVARKGRYREEDFALLQLRVPIRLDELKQEWMAALQEARELVHRLPPEDAGCLFLNPKTGLFVTPGEDLGDLHRHRGTRGGVWPTVGDARVLCSDPQARRELRSAYESRPKDRPRGKQKRNSSGRSG